MEGNKYSLRAVNIQLKADKTIALKNYWMNRYHLSKQIWDKKVQDVLDSGARRVDKERVVQSLNSKYKLLCDEYFNKSQLEFKKWETLIDSLKTEEEEEEEEEEDSTEQDPPPTPSDE
jgi:hypothetical protein